MKPTNRMIYLQLAKIAKARGTLDDKLYRVYVTNMVRALRREQAAAATATRDMYFQNEITSIISQRKVGRYGN